MVKVVRRADTRLYELAQFEELTGVDEVSMAAQQAKRPHRKTADDVIDRFNAEVKIGNLLLAHGYQLGRTYANIERYSRPGREKGQTSVVVWTDENRSYHHSSSDPLYTNGHSRDCFDVFTRLEHTSDASAAYVAAKKQFGLWEEPVEPPFEPDEADEAEQEPADATEDAGEEPEQTTQEDEPSILLQWPVHDHGNASVVKALFPGAFAYCKALGWLAYDGTHFARENGEALVNRAITETLIRRRMAAVRADRNDVVKGTTPNAAKKIAVKHMLQDLVLASVGDFDAHPDLLNCANGVVDLRTGTLVAHSPSNRFTYCAPTPYEPAAQSELWLKFLAESVGDYDQIAAWLQMALGYSISGRTREDVFFYVYGPTRSGKGTFESAKLNMLGDPLAQAVDFRTFTSRRDGDSQNFDLAPLRAARMISAFESGRYSQLNEATVKRITGGDPVTTCFKYHDTFSYVPHYKVWLSSNHPIKGDVDDDAFWGRANVICFPHSHLGQEDKTLRERMSEPETLRAILAWSVEGARRWYASPDGLMTPHAVHAATQQQRSQLDYVQQWLDECARPQADGIVLNAGLYNSYQAWCKANGRLPKASAELGRSLAAKGFEPCYKKVGSKSCRAHRGLVLIDDE